MQAGLPCKGRSRVSTLHRPREPQAAAARFAVARQIARGDYWYLPQIRVPPTESALAAIHVRQKPVIRVDCKAQRFGPTDHSCTPLGRAPRRGRSARDKSVRLVKVPLANARALGGDRMDRARAGRGGGAAHLAFAAGVLLRLEWARASRQHHRNGARDGAALRAYQNLTSRDAAVTKGFSRPSLIPYLRKRNRPSHGGIRAL